MTKRNLARDILDIGIAGAIGGISIGIIEQSPLPTPIKRGAGGLIGVGIISHAAKKLKL